MGKFIDLTGQKFGRLTVLRLDKIRSGKREGAYWICQCECGNTVSVRASYLKSGNMKSCGCVKDQKFIGKKFGRLTVLRKDLDTSKGPLTHWICRCDCGNITSVSGHDLKTGHTKSCGCLKREHLDLTGQKFGKLTVLCQDTENKTAHKVHWLCQCECGNVTSVSGNNLTSGMTKSCGCMHQPDLTGKKFGKLTVLCRDTKRTESSTYWLCHCECGNVVSVRRSKLISGHTRSCGCMTESHGEADIKRYFDDHGFVENTDYRRQVKFDDLYGRSNHLSYDFEVFRPSHFLLEYQGRQHYVPIDYFGGQKTFNAQVARDKAKADYANDHGIPLFYISYENDTYDKVAQAMDAIFQQAENRLSNVSA